MKRIPKLLFFCIILLGKGLPVCSQDARPLIRFGMVTDVHYADIPDIGEKTYNQSLDKLEECVDTMNRQGVDFLIELGDFKDIGETHIEAKSLIYLYRAEKTFSGFQGPRYHVLGNHDVDCISKSQFLSVAKNSGIPESSTYYSFSSKGIHFVVLDADFDSTGREYEKGHFKWSDANIPGKELEWLKKDLHMAAGPVFVFCHQLLDGQGEIYVKNSKEVRKILEKSGVVTAVFQGHYHDGQYHYMKGIHYYTLKALVEGSGRENNSYAIVSVYPDRVQIKGYRRAESMQFGIGN